MTKKFLVLIISFLIFIPQPSGATTGNHFGERKFLSYSIEYLDPLGTTVVDETGITYKPFTCCVSYEDTILPDEYFGDYTLYFAGGILNFKVMIKNDGPRTFPNLKIETLQEFLNIAGGEGEAMSEDNKNTWFIEKLEPGEEVTLAGEFWIPRVTESGIDQTHLRITHWSQKDRGDGFGGQFQKGQIILEDFQAGLWCPVR